MCIRDSSMFMGVAGALTVVFAAFRLLFASDHRTATERLLPAVGALAIGIGLLAGAWWLPV